MSKYNKEMLVTYLSDLSALHMAKLQVEQKMEELEERYEEAVYEKENVPEPTIISEEETGAFVGGLLVGIFLIIVGFMDIIIISFLAGLLGWIMAIPCAIFLISGASKNADIRERNDREIARYRKEQNKCIERIGVMEMIMPTQKQAASKEIEKIDEALDVLYRANVIPRRYRDNYVIFYLYDWFSTGSSTDLDMALNTFVLEEIKERLDTVIEQQAASLMNQKMILAAQYRSMEQQREYHKELIAKVDRLNASAEERNQYLQMIEGNTATIAYFAQTEYYLKK